MAWRFATGVGAAVGGAVALGGVVKGRSWVLYTWVVSVRASRHQSISQALRPVGFSIPLKVPGDEGATR